MPSAVRVSATTFTSFSLSIIVIIGSELTMASISARRAAATAVDVVPVPMNEASSAFSPPRTIM